MKYYRVLCRHDGLEIYGDSTHLNEYLRMEKIAITIVWEVTYLERRSYDKCQNVPWLQRVWLAIKTQGGLEGRRSHDKREDDPHN